MGPPAEPGIEGRSPRSRGRLRWPPQFLAATGPIPALAGETADGRPQSNHSKADPRARGGDGSMESRKVDALGRSPRSRGRRTLASSSPRTGGPIPALAGETTLLASRLHSFEADPRARGGDRWGDTAHDESGGRSPRSRGRHLSHGGMHFRVRPIPALAGETPSCARLHFHSKADPRARGGDSVATRYSPRSWGRSPRSRGRRHGLVGVLLGSGPIPALAGETKA